MTADEQQREIEYNYQPIETYRNIVACISSAIDQALLTGDISVDMSATIYHLERAVLAAQRRLSQIRSGG